MGECIHTCTCVGVDTDVEVVADRFARARKYLGHRILVFNSVNEALAAYPAMKDNLSLKKPLSFW